MVLPLALACGGVAGVGGGGSDFAQNFAKHAETEYPRAVPVPTYGELAEVTVGDFSYRFGKTVIMDAENDLPWVPNVTERNLFSKDGVKLMVLELDVRNNSPVKAKADAGISIRTRGGEKLRFGAYNEDIYRKEHNRYNSTTLPPGEWVPTAYAMAVQPDDADGAIAWMTRTITEINPRDPRGRKHTVVVEQAIVDLSNPEPGPHVNAERR